MLVRIYNHKLDYKRLKELIECRSLPITLLDDIPMYGLVAIKSNKLVAYGGLRRVENHAILLDSFITNPEESSQNRSKAIHRITDKGLKLAKANGIKRVLIISKEPNILDRATKDFGFSYISEAYKLQSLNL